MNATVTIDRASKDPGRKFRASVMAVHRGAKLLTAGFGDTMEAAIKDALPAVAGFEVGHKTGGESE